MSIERFMQEGRKLLKVHVMKKVNGSNYIGGDGSLLVHMKLDTSNVWELEENHSYSLIKPAKFDEQTIVLNSEMQGIGNHQNQHLSNRR